MTSTLPLRPTLPATGPDGSARATGTAALAAALVSRTDLWEPLVRFREESRWTALLDTDRVAAVLDPSLHDELAQAQVWLLSWLPGQGTDLHDHGPSSGSFAVARGTLTERVVAAPRGRRVHETTNRLEAGRLRYFGSHYVHQVTNRDAEAAVSVHVYAPALRLMNTYRVTRGRLVRTGTERAGVDW
jgi:predicted metal-dependent enzyme (double-stranded beta helix superfamily)